MLSRRATSIFTVLLLTGVAAVGFFVSAELLVADLLLVLVFGILALVERRDSEEGS